MHILMRVLIGQVFYFAWSADVSAKWDLTKPASKQSRPLLPDSKYVWNEYLMTPFSQFGIRASDWLVSLVCGFVEDKIVYSGSAQVRNCKLTLEFTAISKSECSFHYPCILSLWRQHMLREYPTHDQVANL